MLFAINQHGHFFIIDGNVNLEKMKTCTFHDTIDDLHKAAANANNVPVDAVVGCEYKFRFIEEKNEWKMINISGQGDYVELEEGQSIEEYLDNWHE